MKIQAEMNTEWKMTQLGNSVKSLPVEWIRYKTNISDLKNLTSQWKNRFKICMNFETLWKDQICSLLVWKTSHLGQWYRLDFKQIQRRKCLKSKERNSNTNGHKKYRTPGNDKKEIPGIILQWIKTTNYRTKKRYYSLQEKSHMSYIRANSPPLKARIPWNKVSKF